MVGKGSDFTSATQEALAGDSSSSSSSSTPEPPISLGKGSDHRQFPDIKNEHASEPTPTVEPAPTANTYHWQLIGIANFKDVNFLYVR